VCCPCFPATTGGSSGRPSLECPGSGGGFRVVEHVAVSESGSLGMSSKRSLCCSFSYCFDVFVICKNLGTSKAGLCACFFFFVSHPPPWQPSPVCSTRDSGLLLVGAHPHSQSGGGPTPTISWEQTCRKTGSIAQEGERGQSPRSPGIASIKFKL
jgi:hypothetical protein